MAGKGDIGDVTRLVDTITGSAGAQEATTFTSTFAVATPTLVTGSHAAPAAQGGLGTDAGSKTDPDFYVGSFALASTTPTLGVGTVAGPAGKGDAGDVFGAPDLGMDVQVAGFAAFASATPTLVTGSHAVPPEHGDVGDTGGPTTLQGDTNDSNAGFGTLTSWSSGTASLALGGIPQKVNQGDIGNMEGRGEGPIGQVVWAVVPVALGVGTISAPAGSGDIADPYSWEDAVFFLTSQIYPIDVIEHLTASQPMMLDQPQLQNQFDHLAVQQAVIVAGTLTVNLITYSNGLPEHMQCGQATITAGSLIVGLLVYSNWPAEHLQTSQPTVTAGSLTVGLVTYSNWPAEHIQSGQATITAGTLT